MELETLSFAHYSPLFLEIDFHANMLQPPPCLITVSLQAGDGSSHRKKVEKTYVPQGLRETRIQFLQGLRRS